MVGASGNPGHGGFEPAWQLQGAVKRCIVYFYDGTCFLPRSMPWFHVLKRVVMALDYTCFIPLS